MHYYYHLLLSINRANLSEKNVLLVMQHICLYCTGANASNTAANQTDLSLWDSSAGAGAGAEPSGPVITTGPTHTSSISHCNSAGCNGDHSKPTAPPVSSTEEADEEDDDDDFIDEDNPLLLDQVGNSKFASFA